MVNHPDVAADSTVAAMAPEHRARARRSYADGIATGHATLETVAPDWETWDRNHRPECRPVARDGDDVIAWAALSPVSARACYAGVAEHSIYVDGSRRGRGAGKRLLAALVQASEAAGFQTLQRSVFPENRASIAIHLACGFRILGRRKRVAVLNGVWRDTVVVERGRRVVVG